MGKKKTVLKGFPYLKCDDFAAYLMQMAQKGWHFKEWRAGLVFEKGEPADTVYAVEVFIDGSEYDTRPEVHTQEFAAYCEAAGWELVDAKRKFCIFRKARADAVDILTPEERLQNIAKEEQKQILYYLLTSTAFLVLQLLGFTGSSFVSRIFSNTHLFMLLLWAALWIGALGREIHFLLWKAASKRKLEQGQPLYFGSKGNAFSVLYNWNLWICAPALLIYALLSLYEGQYWPLVFAAVILTISLVVSFFISKFRPDAQTNQIIQIVIPLAIIALVLMLAVGIFVSDNTVPPYEEDAPLVCEDVGIDAGEIQAADISGFRSIFGSAMKYWLFYEDVHIYYYVYRSDHQWILDRLWNQEMSVLNWSGTDVTNLWDAEVAILNQIGDYTIRYPDAVILLALPGDTVLTPEQIEFVRAALYESR